MRATQVDCYGRNPRNRLKQRRASLDDASNLNLLSLRALDASRLKIFKKHTTHVPPNRLVVGRLAIEGRAINIDEPLTFNLFKDPDLSADILAESRVSGHVEERVLLNRNVLYPGREP